MLFQGIHPGPPPAEGGTDVILVHLIQDGGAQHFNGHRHPGQGHRQGREEHVEEKLPRAVCKGHKISRYKHPQGDPEDKAQQDAHKHRRNGHTDLIDHRDDPVQPAPLPPGRGNPQGEGGRHRDGEGQQHQGRRGRQLLQHHVLDRQVVAVRLPPVSLDEIRHPPAIPNQHRVVQSHLFLQLRHLFRGGVGPQHTGGRGPGNHLKGQEGEKGNNEQCNNESEELAQNIFHPLALLSLSGMAQGAGFVKRTGHSGR